MNPQNLLKNWILPIIIISLGYGGYKLLLKLKPQAKVVPPTERIVPVKIQELGSIATPVQLHAAGTVEAAKQIALQPEVSGRIYKTAEAFLPGGEFKAGEPMLWINPVDLEAALAQTRSTLAQAEYAYRQELGWQEVARHEWDLIEDHSTVTELEKELTLRKPQLDQAKAQLDAARAAVAKAQLDLDRACIKAPFNCRIISRSVELGSQITTQTTLATLSGTDEYWVRATIPVEDLQWLEIPGTTARIRLGKTSEKYVAAEVFALEPAIESNGRLARIVLRIPNPTTRTIPILIDSYVYADLEGRSVENVYAIPADALHQGSVVWLMNREDRLEIRPVSVLWRTRDQVFIGEGLADGEGLIITDIPSPIPGMKLASKQEKKAE
ncbi:MAG: efflux RND transporter periplasmic adaptor subunit [Pontiellaceae bacterium]|nr:efflux RND transporter periplasmic adaptor subunit [Pontiellaceae bacterium]MBN2785035.1 efflux RND transporter periplasmic adaptor subunit [Pontiellaceae bacterium]